MTGVVAVFRYIDPEFSVGFLDLLVQFSLTAWMILLLSTAIIFAVLSNLPVLVRTEPAKED